MSFESTINPFVLIEVPTWSCSSPGDGLLNDQPQLFLCYLYHSNRWLIIPVIVWTVVFSFIWISHINKVWLMFPGIMIDLLSYSRELLWFSWFNDHPLLPIGILTEIIEFVLINPNGWQTELIKTDEIFRINHFRRIISVTMIDLRLSPRYHLVPWNIESQWDLYDDSMRLVWWLSIRPTTFRGSYRSLSISIPEG